MDGDPATRLRIALELHELGVEMQRQRLRRERPGVTDAELDDAIRAWLLAGEHGDVAGVPSDGPQ